MAGARCVTSRAAAGGGAARAGRRPALFLSLQAVVPNRSLCARGARRSAALWPLQYRARWGITLTGSEGLAYLGERCGRRFVVYEELSPSTGYASYQGNFCLSKLDLSYIAALYVLRD